MDNDEDEEHNDDDEENNEDEEMTMTTQMSWKLLIVVFNWVKRRLLTWKIAFVTARATRTRTSNNDNNNNNNFNNINNDAIKQKAAAKKIQ